MAKKVFEKSKRLRLIPMSDEELETYAADCKDESLKNIYSKKLLSCKADPNNRLWYTLWKICLKEQGTEVGTVTFNGPQVKGKVEIGYAVYTQFEGNGYATEAVKTMTAWAFNQKDVYTVVAETEKENLASQKVLAKAEFQPIGLGKKGTQFVKLKAAVSQIGVYMCFGIAIGLSVGRILDNSTVYMSVGIALGVLIGFMLDIKEKKHRAQVEGKSAVQLDSEEELVKSVKDASKNKSSKEKK